MKLRLTGTEDECARPAFLLRFGWPELEVLQVDGPYPNRGGGQVRAYLELRLARQPGPVARTFYSLIDPSDGRPLLVDAWDAPVRHGGAP